MALVSGDHAFYEPKVSAEDEAASFLISRDYEARHLYGPCMHLFVYLGQISPFRVIQTWPRPLSAEMLLT